MKTALILLVLLAGVGCSDSSDPFSPVAFQAGEACILGDVTGDGVANTTDAQQILRYSKGYPIVPANAARIQVAGNVDGNEYIDEIDAFLIARFSVGFDDGYPIGEPCA